MPEPHLHTHAAPSNQAVAGDRSFASSRLAGDASSGPSLGTLLWRALRLRCPVCGEGKLFRGWIRMYDRCSTCQFHYERSPGYWLGSIFVNYGLTALIVTASYFTLFFTEAIPEVWIVRLLLAFCILFPLWFFRYARSIWISIDLYFDPEPAAKKKPTKAAN